MGVETVQNITIAKNTWSLLGRILHSYRRKKETNKYFSRMGSINLWDINPL